MDEEIKTNVPRFNIELLQDFYAQMRKRTEKLFAVNGEYQLQAPRVFFIGDGIRPEPFPASIRGTITIEGTDSFEQPVREEVTVNPAYQAASHEEIVIKAKHPFKMYYQRPKAVQLELFPES